MFHTCCVNVTFTHKMKLNLIINHRQTESNRAVLNKTLFIEFKCSLLTLEIQFEFSVKNVLYEISSTFIISGLWYVTVVFYSSAIYSVKCFLFPNIIIKSIRTTVIISNNRMQMISLQLLLTFLYLVVTCSCLKTLCSSLIQMWQSVKHPAAAP